MRKTEESLGSTKTKKAKFNCKFCMPEKIKKYLKKNKN